MKLTPALLNACMPTATAAACGAWAEPLDEAMVKYGMNTVQRMAGLLASVENETGTLRATKEISYYNTPYEHCVNTFGRRMPSRDIWESWRAEGREVFYNKSFDRLYSDVLWPFLGLGNTQPGDGSRYVGRGVGITGRALYTKYGKVAGIDLVNHPELLEAPKWAAITIAAMWKDVGNNERMDRGDALGAMHILNPGLPDFSRHLGFYEHIRQVLNNGPVAEAPAVATSRALAKGMVGDDVKRLQAALIVAGYLPQGAADGMFGPMTDAAVRKLQANKGLTVDGWCGPMTRKALEIL